jgi:hypothetical protein
MPLATDRATIQTSPKWFQSAQANRIVWCRSSGFSGRFAPGQQACSHQKTGGDCFRNAGSPRHPPQYIAARRIGKCDPGSCARSASAMGLGDGFSGHGTPTNHSAQHGRNTAVRFSFANLGTGRIGPLADSKQATIERNDSKAGGLDSSAPAMSGAETQTRCTTPCHRPVF